MNTETTTTPTNAAELLAALQAILDEVTPGKRPHSVDSYLPDHLVQAARVAVANATRPGSWANA